MKRRPTLTPIQTNLFSSSKPDVQLSPLIPRGRLPLPKLRRIKSDQGPLSQPVAPKVNDFFSTSESKTPLIPPVFSPRPTPPPRELMRPEASAWANKRHKMLTIDCVLRNLSRFVGEKIGAFSQQKGLDVKQLAYCVRHPKDTVANENGFFSVKIDKNSIEMLFRVDPCMGKGKEYPPFLLANEQERRELTQNFMTELLRAFGLEDKVHLKEAQYPNSKDEFVTGYCVFLYGVKEESYKDMLNLCKEQVEVKKDPLISFKNG